MVSGGMQIPGGGTGDDGYDEDGYDESQRAEILEATGEGPTDGVIMTDLAPDLGGDDEVDDDPAGDSDRATQGGGAGPDDADDDGDDADADDDDVGTGDDDAVGGEHDDEENENA